MKIVQIDRADCAITVLFKNKANKHEELVKQFTDDEYRVKLEADPDSGVGNKIKSIQIFQSSVMQREHIDAIYACEDLFSTLWQKNGLFIEQFETKMYEAINAKSNN